MKKYLAVIFGVFCLASLVFAEELGTYVNSAFNFTLRYPQNWEMRSLESMTSPAPSVKNVVAFLSPVENADDKFRENVNVVVETITGQQYTSEEYAKAADETWLKYDTSLKQLDLQKTSISGEPAFYTIVANDKLKFKQYKFVKGDKAFVITYTSELGKFDAFLKTADSIMQSFTFK